MTSINAFRLNFHSGLMVCDEARYWNPEWMIIYTPDKIRSVIDPEISAETGVYLFVGSTGTSSFGDEIIESIRYEIRKRFNIAKEKGDPIPNEISSVENVVEMAFSIVKNLQRTHIDDFLQGKYNLSSQDLIQGFKSTDSQKYNLADEDETKEAISYMTCENFPAELSGLTNNAQLFAGYDPHDGFRLFFMEERNTVLEEVSDIYLAEGSGTITCDLAYSGFASTQPIKAKREGLDRVSTLITMLEGLEEAHTLVAGVGGYPKIMYLDGSQKKVTDKFREISDCRSHLAIEIVAAGAHELISAEKVYKLVDDLIFQKIPFAKVYKAFKSNSSQALQHFLRGYRRNTPISENEQSRGSKS